MNAAGCGDAAFFLLKDTSSLEKHIRICYSSWVMAKKGDKRKQRHYYTTKNTMNTPDKVELVKYCPIKRVQAKQTETKKSLGRNEVKPRR
jgi:large subunit ribosomal protein L33